MVRDIDIPREWSSGTTAIHLACQQGAKEIYLMGFDLSENPLNNMYEEHKEGQMPDDPHAETPWLAPSPLASKRFHSFS